MYSFHLQGKINQNACYMQKMLYDEEKEKNMSRILRYQMLTYIHTDHFIHFLEKT